MLGMSFPNSFSALIRPALLGTATLLLGLAAGCTYSHGDPAPACNVASETITYAGVISPIFDAHCRECHGSTVANLKGGGNDFGSYTTISNYPQANLLGCIRRDPGFDPMPQGRDKLSDCDIQRIEKWYALGKPQ
jgi:mono/diheme cytochrome c family protein